MLKPPKCSVDGCPRPHKGLGFCNAHYQRHLRGTVLSRPISPPYKKGRICSIDGCAEKHVARGCCLSHYRAICLTGGGYNWYEKNRERALGNGRAWRAKNPGRHAAIFTRRNRRSRRAAPRWLTLEQWQEIDALYAEARRLTKETGVRHEVDHVYPIQGKNSCGLHVPWNLQIVTGSHNRKKGNRVPGV